MTEQFGRVCTLILGRDGSGVNFAGLRVRFSIKKTSDSTANEAKIELYNPNPDHAGLLLKSWADIVLMAGYESNVSLIFTGQIRRVTRRVEGTDRILTIESGDGDHAIEKGTVNTTLAKGTTDRDALAACQNGMGVAVGHADPVSKTPRSRGKVLSGKASAELSKVTTHNDAAWSVQDGQLLLLKSGQVRPNAVWRIASDTGMVGSPEEAEDGGVKVATLLNPGYLIGGLAMVEGVGYTGGIRIESIEHRGDTHGMEWVSQLQGAAV